jgi:hypothetical protein
VTGSLPGGLRLLCEAGAGRAGDSLCEGRLAPPVRHHEHANDLISNAVHNDVRKAFHHGAPEIRGVREVRKPMRAMPDALDGCSNGVHEFAAEALLSFFVPALGRAELIARFGLDPGFHTLESSCSASSQSSPSDSPLRTRSARRSISARKPASSSCGTVAGRKLARSSAASAARSGSDSFRAFAKTSRGLARDAGTGEACTFSPHPRKPAFHRRTPRSSPSRLPFRAWRYSRPRASARALEAPSGRTRPL